MSSFSIHIFSLCATLHGLHIVRLDWAVFSRAVGTLGIRKEPCGLEKIIVVRVLPNIATHGGETHLTQMFPAVLCIQISEEHRDLPLDE